MNKPIYLYIVPFFPAENYWRGGYFYDAVKSLQADGRYDIRVISTSEVYHDYDYKGIHVIDLKKQFIGSSQYFETFLEKTNDIILEKKLATLGINPCDIAVCHIHDHNHYVHYATFIKRKNPKCLTLVHHHYSGWYNIEFGKLKLFPIFADLRYLHLQKQYLQVDGHVFISEDSKNSFGKTRSQDSCEDYKELRETLALGALLPKLKYKDSYVWYNGVDSSIFKPTDIPKSRGHVIGCVGNFNPGKSQIDLIKAFILVKKQYPDALLKFVGSGRMLQHCMDYANNAGLSESVEFIKEMPHDQLADFYRSLNLFVMPSINEGFCCVNAEANFCGVPAMACEGLPFEELIANKDKEKWLIPKHNPEAIAQKIITFFQSHTVQVFTKNLDSNYLATKFLDWVDAKREQINKEYE